MTVGAPHPLQAVGGRAALRLPGSCHADLSAGFTSAEREETLRTAGERLPPLAR